MHSNHKASRFVSRVLRRWTGSLLTFLHAPVPAKPKPAMLPKAVLPHLMISLACPSCGKQVQITSQVEAYCVNPLCEDVLDVCRVTFIMQSLREPSDAPHN